LLITYGSIPTTNSISTNPKEGRLPAPKEHVHTVNCKHV
jgi:hypothetical protein